MKASAAYTIDVPYLTGKKNEIFVAEVIMVIHHVGLSLAKELGEVLYKMSIVSDSNL